jgi:ribonuclease R
LGDPNDVRVTTLSIIRSFNLFEEFPKEVEEEAKRVAIPIERDDQKNRKDFRDRLIITIDGDDARDFDDAISLTKNGENYNLGVYIADVSHYVKHGSKIDEEAFKRGTSVYFPDHVLPMLPISLSNGMCSLNPNEDRRITIEEVLKHPWIIEEEYETILNKLENKSKIKGISPINSKEDENANMSLYKEIKEIEKAIDCKTNEIEQFNNKTKQMLNDVVKETSLITKRKENLIKTHIHDLSNSTFKNENFNFNDSIIVRRKEKNGKIKKKNKKMHNYLNDITNNNKFNENSTQTEIDIMNERKNSWNLLDIFKCGSH